MARIEYNIFYPAVNHFEFIKNGTFFYMFGLCEISRGITAAESFQENTKYK